jgi:hypothetical protein
MWQALIGPISNLVGGWLKNKAEEKQALHERKLETIKHEANWDTIQAQNAGSSWKDEWLTLLVSIPLIGAFIPDFVPVIRDGFQVLETMPDYYKAMLGAVFAASFGIRAMSKWK